VNGGPKGYVFYGIYLSKRAGKKCWKNGFKLKMGYSRRKYLMDFKAISKNNHKDIWGNLL
jgi:hypothetical protein|tara:strand:+ start:689 stop:868 length:180 start_codon:yes stop_codon:yes gene_type:complete